MDVSKNKIWTFVGSVIILSVLAGGFSGVISAVFTNQSLDRYVQSLSEGEGLVLISEVKPSPIPGTYEEALSRVQETGWKATALIRATSVDSSLPSAWINRDDVVGYGAVITSDGWIVLHSDVLNAFVNPESSAEVWIDGERYSISSIVQDSLSDLSLIKISAEGLSVVAFGASDSMRGGSILFGVPSSSGILVSNLLDSDYQDSSALPAETFDSSWVLSDELPAGIPILNSAGELIAFSLEDSGALPLHHGIVFIQSVLRSGQAEHAALGSYVVNVASILNINPELRMNAEAGALLIAPNGIGNPIVSGGPADLAGLQKGDLILAVDNYVLSNFSSLAEAIASYSPGSSATFSVMRDGVVSDYKITFSNLSDLVY
ncbi:MAG: PDZ domain-containing protein [Candidatus Uhrbacteria bacterium]|nr:PDZ domain-containing protein [Candidatus Uhrbacteria bacterium]